MRLITIMNTIRRSSANSGAVDSGVLWILGGAAVYFAMQLWILPKMGVST